MVGNVALKSIYVGYTDASFTKRNVQPADYGYLGPLIKAQVRIGNLWTPQTSSFQQKSDYGEVI